MTPQQAPSRTAVLALVEPANAADAKQHATAQRDKLLAQAKDLTDQVDDLDRQRADVKAKQVEVMKAMRTTGFSWVAIGEVMKMTSTAVMYATGAAVRTATRKKAPSGD
ncbi:hypothetical protein GCM10025867_47430 (plasmid) [Frondihabitans sucicola]|uniref:DUF3618 domain-containing protein n=1 Tax=Frondihabitans sucicola TaxID=1268041 RepID=A0ABM8GVR2_9MICO|nr:hypothetical protein [Frondihabitans sucicola]BDZ52502.1 hypothetical protein GCM10025867_47430 [Frondihabitans sucicola]